MSDLDIIEQLEGIIRKQDDDLERLRRLSVRIFDECGECGGTGIDDDGNPWEIEGLPPPTCPSCDGKGLVLRDGAMSWYSAPIANGVEKRSEWVIFPASMMEADSE